jgi:hypothetical protein
MVLSFGQISNNLQEIYYAAHQKDKSLSLVANLTGTRIYYSGKGWGRIWTVLYFLLFLLFLGSVRENRLKLAAMKTSLAFQNVFGDIQKAFFSYEKLLAQKCEDISIAEKDLEKARYETMGFIQGTYPFLKLLQENNPKMERIYATYFAPLDLEIGKPHLGSSICLQETNQYRQLLDLEGLLENSLPYPSLTKLAFRKRLSTEDEENLENFVKAIKEKTTLGVRKLHHGLKCFVQHLKKFHTNIAVNQPSLERIEAELYRKGLKIFENDDPKQITFRDRLKEGCVVICNGHSYTLGKELESEKIEGNQNRVFLLKDAPTKVLISGKNTAILGLKHYIADSAEVAAAIRYPEIYEINTGTYFEDQFQKSQEGIKLTGTIALVKRLTIPLSSLTLKTGNSLSREDEWKLRPIVGQIKWLIEEDITPTNMDLRYLLFNEEEEYGAEEPTLTLYTTKPTGVTLFRYHVLEQFAWEACHGNQMVFKIILQHSTLGVHRQRDFYRDVVQSHLKDEDLSPKRIAALSRHAIIDPEIIKRGEELLEFVKTSLKKIIKKIHKTHKRNSSTQIEALVKEIFLSEYLKQQAVSFLITGFKKNVVSLVSKRLRTM